MEALQRTQDAACLGRVLGGRESFEGYALEGAHVSSGPFRKTKRFTHEGGIATR